MKCELCDREIVDTEISIHHLIPKANNGAGGPTAKLHQICHKQIHALFTNIQLTNTYNTIYKLKAHNDVDRFIKWVSKKPINFNARVRIRRKNR